MTQRADQLSLSLGKADPERRKYALDRYVTDREIIGYRQTSISELVCRIADALDFDYPQAAMYLDDLMTLAGTSYVVEEELVKEHGDT